MADPYQQLLGSGTPAQVATPSAPSAPSVPATAAPSTTPPPITTIPSDKNASGLPNNDLFNNILPAINKFSNSALMGIPAAIMHRIGNDANFSTTPQNKTVGTISGLLGTGAGIAGSIATGNTLGIGSKIGANMLVGGAMSGAAPAIAGDSDWLKKSAEGAGMGALGAVGGKVIEKVLPSVFKGLAGKTGELADDLDKAGLGSLFDLNKGDIKKVLNASKKFSGSAPGLAGTENVVKQAADLVRAKDIYGMAKLKSFLQGMGPEYQQAAKAFDSAGVKISIPTFTEDLASVAPGSVGKTLDQADNPIFKKIMETPEVQNYLKNYGDQGGADKIQTLLTNFDKRGSWTEGRSYLTKEQSSLYKTPGGALNTVENGELADAVGGIKHAVTEHGFDLGGVDPELTGLYRDSRVLNNLALRKASSPAEFAKAGSKTITGVILSGVGGAAAGPGGAFGFPVLADVINRGATSIANKTMGYGSLQAAPFVRNVLEPLAAKAQPIGDAIAGGAYRVGQATPAITNAVSSQAIRSGGDQAIPGVEQPSESTKGQAINDFPVDENSPQFKQKIEEGIRQHWLMGGNGYADPNFSSPQFKRFEAAIKQHIQDSGPDAMRIAAPVLFPASQENRKAYLEYIASKEGVDSTYSGAQFGNQLQNQTAKLPFVGNPDAVAKREQFQAALAKAVGSEKAAAAYMTQLDRAKPKDRKKIIAEAVGRNNPIATRLLQSLGGKNGV